jgi:hypothetical protein
LSISVGLYAWWYSLPLPNDRIAFLCQAIADGRFFEESRTLAGFTLARRATLELPGEAPLRWAKLSAFLLLPLTRWKRRDFKPWREP